MNLVSTANAANRARGVAAALGAILIVALLCSGAAQAAGTTTGAGSRLDIYFILTDQKIELAIYGLSDYAGTNELYIEARQNVVRGDVALINVVNRSKTAHTFSIFGKKVSTKPGAKKHFTVALLHRGSFPYFAGTSANPKGMKGALAVY